MIEVKPTKLFGKILIEERCRQLGISYGDLANKCGTPKGRFYDHITDPNRMTLREARCISVCLGFTVEEIYNSFIMLYGWERKYVEGTSSEVSGDEVSPDSESDKGK